MIIYDKTLLLKLSSYGLGALLSHTLFHSLAGHWIVVKLNTQVMKKFHQYLAVRIFHLEKQMLSIAPNRLETISKVSHIIFSLCARFVKFVNKIGSCNKPSMINLLNTVMYDCQSRTGSNIRNILLKLRKMCIDIRNLRYFEIPNGSKWEINSVKECINHISGFLMVPGLNHSEIKEIRDIICIT